MIENTMVHGAPGSSAQVWYAVVRGIVHEARKERGQLSPRGLPKNDDLLYCDVETPSDPRR